MSKKLEKNNIDGRIKKKFLENFNRLNVNKSIKEKYKGVDINGLIIDLIYSNNFRNLLEKTIDEVINDEYSKSVTIYFDDKKSDYIKNTNNLTESKVNDVFLYNPIKINFEDSINEIEKKFNNNFKSKNEKKNINRRKDTNNKLTRSDLFFIMYILIFLILFRRMF